MTTNTDALVSVERLREALEPIKQGVDASRWHYHGGERFKRVLVAESAIARIDTALSTPSLQTGGDGEVVARALALVRRIAARESWQSHYGKRWEDEAAEIVASPKQAPVYQGEVEQRGEMRAVARIVNVARAIGIQAGVGGRETAGAIVSYLATSPDEIGPFMDGTLSPLDFKGDWMLGGCLSWHAANGKVVHPEDIAALSPSSPVEGEER